MLKILITSTIVFLAVILILVFAILYMKKKFFPARDVKININGKKDLSCPAGASLLSTLAEKDIYLPSACGGQATCGMCKVRVLNGGGDLLPTELAHISRKEQAQNYRLACQVKVKNDMNLQVEESVFGVKKWECEVVSNRNVSTFIKEFTIKLPEGEHLNFRSGGYIQIDVPKCTVDYSSIEVADQYRKDWEKMDLFSLKMKNPEPIFRAYSMANYPAEGDIVRLNVRIATPPFDRKKGRMAKVNPGICSSYIWSLKAGDKVKVSGPYGQFFIKEDSQKEMLFIGGGAGMAPMRSHIFDQLATRNTQRKMTFWYGGRSLKELFYTQDFEELEKQHSNFSFHIALSEPQAQDNWKGYTGFIHQVIYDNYLKNHPNPEDIEYYLCGPPMMTASAIKMLHSLGVEDENIMFDDFGA
jgi:NADH:ubiquinone oxidoreductase, Na(+)-translocating, F subunit